jgi:N-formylglutamate amidohydrolase
MEYFTVFNEDEHKFPVVINLPHSGVFVPPDIKKQFLPDVCLSNSDWFLPELYDFLPEMGCTTIVNNLSRYVVDVNRPDVNEKNGNYRKTVVYQENTQGKPLYLTPPDENEIDKRIKMYYRPYHQALEMLLKKKLHIYPSVLLLDLHSFFINFSGGGNQDIYLSNRCGTTSSEQVLQELYNCFTKQGYSVINNAIMGGHIIHHYRELFGKQIEGVLMELRYTKYIEDRYFGEEVLEFKDERLFSLAKKKLKDAFMQLRCFQNQ